MGGHSIRLSHHGVRKRYGPMRIFAFILNVLIASTNYGVVCTMSLETLLVSCSLGESPLSGCTNYFLYIGRCSTFLTYNIVLSTEGNFKSPFFKKKNLLWSSGYGRINQYQNIRATESNLTIKMGGCFFYNLGLNLLSMTSVGLSVHL